VRACVRACVRARARARACGYNKSVYGARELLCSDAVAIRNNNVWDLQCVGVSALTYSCTVLAIDR